MPIHRSGAKTVKQHAVIKVPGLKVTVPLPADTIPRDLVPMEGPAGEPVLEVVLEGSTLTARAKLNGKNYRKMLKMIAEHGSGNVSVILQGVLRPPVAQGGAFVLEGAGFQVNIKMPGPQGGGGPAPAPGAGEAGAG